jgi:aminopeptidase YwaD
MQHRFSKITASSLLALLLVLAFSISLLCAQAETTPPRYPVLDTPLSQDILTLLANEISGQIIFNNEVVLAGAPWIREQAEFTDTFYESHKIYDMVRKYGIETVRLDRYPSDREFEYPLQGEFWILEPEEQLIARLDADAALIASSSGNVDLTGDLVYIPPLSGEDIKAWTGGQAPKQYQGKIALMWSHANRTNAKALDAAGVCGVISFSSRERYFDPDQVVYARGSYSDMDNLKFGFTISWRQWSELMEDVERGQTLTVRCKTKLGKYQDKFENVFCWIPGSEPDKKGVIFSAHLFEGYTKRGANDNMSGCVVQLEILRALSKLIAQGALPQPRRTIYFLWPNEISGTYEHFKQNPELVEKYSTNINMDMVGEALRKNNALFTMTESPYYLPSYLDGLGNTIMNYVWRTNDIVYSPDSPRGRQGGQYFPRPMWEKNGSRDAFRYYTHHPTGGSDHLCFNSASVAVPGIELNIWPDQWYHADTDTPDKSDPTQLKRTAFIGAAMAWAAADCSDEVLTELLDAVSSFGYKRVGQRELPEALRSLENANADELQDALEIALILVDFAANRESGAVRSIQDIFSGSDRARQLIENYTAQWGMYSQSLQDQVMNYARLKAEFLNSEMPQKPEPTAEHSKYAGIVPVVHPDFKAKEFSAERTEVYLKFAEENPDAIKELKLDVRQRRTIQNYLNGRHSITNIWKWVQAESKKSLEFSSLVKYLEILKNVGWLVY